MNPLQISADTAVKLAAKLKVPIEHLMHMPQHILMQKIAELAKEEAAHPSVDSDSGASGQAGQAGQEPDPS
ncbi:MAG: YycC family protein [Paenibacillus sp.]|uniref:YycC family protein n=1 Tax=Paenibacillus sp. TaxID=58172 RepID=UPI0029074BA0|nr:YycC family protein [Paenibacillus sp.]MDU4697539.1 YycC family protein [Paenibacillus sp.]